VTWRATDSAGTSTQVQRTATVASNSASGWPILAKNGTSNETQRLNRVNAKKLGILCTKGRLPIEEWAGRSASIRCQRLASTSIAAELAN